MRTPLCIRFLARATCVLAATTLLGLLGCNQIQDAGTVTLDEDDLAPAVVDRRYTLASIALQECTEGTYAATEPDGDSRTVVVESRGSNCAIGLRAEDVVLFDEEQVRTASEALDGFEADGIESIDLRVEEFAVTDAAGASLIPLTRNLELAVEGTTLLTGADLRRVGEEPVVVSLPTELVDVATESLEQTEPITVDVEVHLVVPREELVAVPDMLVLSAVLQPLIDIDVLEAAI